MCKILLPFFILIFHLSACAQKADIIPQPVSVQIGKGKFTISKKTVIATRDELDRKAANFLNDYLQQVYGFRLDIDKQESKDYIRLSTRKFVKAPEKESYTLVVNNDGVSIEGDTYAATFHGIQTLIQLLPVEYSKPQNGAHRLEITHITVQDYPRFGYRGMHLDVGRHMFPVSFIKRYIDYIALHKMNYFHWHLTEDQGWRIEIKKYPKLMSTAAYRNGTIVGRYPGIKNDNQPYGGYYTQEEVKDVVKYAADRHINVVPEIEMPGHSSAAIAAYPWLSCFPEKETVIPANPSELSKKIKGKKVQETWGVFDDIYCAGKDSTFTFLEGVMEEVLQLFPSQYIHVGGDEAPKGHWKKCPNCQARIKKEGLKDEHHLQSYFIQRMEKYLNAKGRTLVGWDEILEGGLAPNAIVMSWQGEKGGIVAAKQKHQVIMTPEPYVYLNWSQTRYEDSVTFGRFTPVEKVYSYEPIPKELTEEEGKYVLGAQGNVWTEYIRYPTTVEYNIFPRMSALAEVLWTPKENKNWDDFESRLASQFKRYDQWKSRYSNAYYGITPTVMEAPKNNGVLWKLESKNPKAKIILVPSNGKSFTYTKPLLITSPVDYTAKLLVNNKVIHELKQPFRYNLATGKKVTLAKAPMSSYAGQGAFSLVNGIYSYKGLSFPDWLGWAAADVEAIIDLEKPTLINELRFHTLDQTPSWIWLPQYVEVLTSTDGKNFTPAGRESKFVSDTLTSGFITVKFPEKKTRYVKVVAKNYGTIPEGNPGAGSKSLLFVDEILIY